jgi:ABC-type multidrug transport system fused ATPase/permease subunit
MKAYRPYTWHYVLSIFLQHRREIVLANCVAIAAAALSVPVPLLLPLLVDEVLLDKPGRMLAALDTVFPEAGAHDELIRRRGHYAKLYGKAQAP